MKNAIYYKWFIILGILLISCTEDEDSLIDSPTVTEEETTEVKETIIPDTDEKTEDIEKIEEAEVTPIEEIAEESTTDEMEAPEEDTVTETVPEEFSILNINPTISDPNSLSLDIRLEPSNATLFDVLINETFTIRDLRNRPSLVLTLGETIGDGPSGITFETDEDGTIIPSTPIPVRLIFTATLPENLRPSGENTVTVIARNSFGNTTSTNTLRF